MKLPDRGALVAIVALHGGVGSQKRKPILVILDLVDGNLPAENRVTLRAIGAELSQVNVCMAIRAVLPDIGEYRLRMAFNTSNFFVLPTQRIGGFVVVELQHAAYRTPRRCGVTVFARNRQRSVRTANISLLSGKCRDEQKQPKNEQRPCDQMCVLKRILPSPPVPSRGGAQSAPSVASPTKRNNCPVGQFCYCPPITVPTRINKGRKLIASAGNAEALTQREGMLSVGAILNPKIAS